MPRSANDDEFVLELRQRAPTLAGCCVVCWDPVQVQCQNCQHVGYCSTSHAAKHASEHRQFCVAVHKLVEKSDGCLYGKSVKEADPDEWRSIRFCACAQIEQILGRQLKIEEREVLLFPQACSCHETCPKLLKPCAKCKQVWFCRNQPKHLLPSHRRWCEAFKLLASLAKRQAAGKEIRPNMTTHCCASNHPRPQDMNRAIKHMLISSRKSRIDECEKSILSLMASGPLTALHTFRTLAMEVKDQKLCIHLVGAEIFFEVNALHAWEMFFLHMMPELKSLKVVLVGPELNCHGLPLYQLRHKRLCEICQQQSRSVTFEFESGLYHEFEASSRYNTMVPDLICAFNPGLHRATGFQNNDTWPATIGCIVGRGVPFATTAYTEYEAPRDLDRIKEVAPDVEIAMPPTPNPFASQRPDRNFISDHEAPLIFKNYYLTVVRQNTKDK